MVKMTNKVKKKALKIGEMFQCDQCVGWFEPSQGVLFHYATPIKEELFICDKCIKESMER